MVIAVSELKEIRQKIEKYDKLLSELWTEWSSAAVLKRISPTHQLKLLQVVVPIRPLTIRALPKLKFQVDLALDKLEDEQKRIDVEVEWRSVSTKVTAILEAFNKLESEDLAHSSHPSPVAPQGTDEALSRAIELSLRDKKTIRNDTSRLKFGSEYDLDFSAKPAELFDEFTLTKDDKPTNDKPQSAEVSASSSSKLLSQIREKRKTLERIKNFNPPREDPVKLSNSKAANSKAQKFSSKIPQPVPIDGIFDFIESLPREIHSMIDEHTESLIGTAKSGSKLSYEQSNDDLTSNHLARDNIQDEMFKLLKEREIDDVVGRLFGSYSLSDADQKEDFGHSGSGDRISGQLRNKRRIGSSELLEKLYSERV